MKLKISYRKKKNLLFRKIISKSLAIGLLLNNGLYSFAGVLSEDGRYETFRDSNITVNDVLEEDKVDVKIEGNTLVNLVEKGNEEKSLLYSNSTMAKYKLKYTLKENTTYTIVADIKNLDDSESSNVIISLNAGVNGIGINTFKNGFNVITCNTYTVNNPTELWVSFNKSDIISINPTIKNVMLFEGDLTSNPPIEYFEGIQSSFENQLVTQEMIDSGEEKEENLGKYKVELKSTGKNKFLLKETINSSNNATILEDGSIQFSQNGNRVYLICDGGYKHNTTYSISFNKISGQCRFNVFYTDGTRDSYSNSFTTDNMKTVDYIRSNWSDGSISVLSNIQIEEGSVATPYEPYKESINTFYLNSPLLEGDRIEIINSQAYHVKISDKVMLDGSESWKYNHGVLTEETRIETLQFYTPLLDSKVNGYGSFICDKLKKENVYKYDIVGIDIVSSVYEKLRIGHTSKTVKEFKNWLSKNPVTIVYELANPVYEPIKADLSIQLFETTAHVSNNSNVPTNMKITVDRVLNRAVEAIELAKVNPNVENIAKARMWTNLLKESIKKDDLHNEINNITNIDDLTIDKKTTTSNMDLYIKPENSLSMSLSINNIVFEDYSSVNDIDMSNAVQITINSSLPYQLNSYLMTDIQNASGSSKIDKDKLNIKESSDIEYKQFLGINQKLTLKEDCEAGKSNIHDIDFKLKASTHDADIYKTTIKFEVEQK